MDKNTEKKKIIAFTIILYLLSILWIFPNIIVPLNCSNNCSQRALNLFYVVKEIGVVGKYKIVGFIKNIYVTGDCAAFLSLKIDMQDTEKFKQEVKTHLIYRGWKNIENKKDRIVYSRNKQKVALVAEGNDTWCVVITDVENQITKILYPRVNF